jgi:hypothetical protein
MNKRVLLTLFCVLCEEVFNSSFTLQILFVLTRAVLADLQGEKYLVISVSKITG